jgi:hypothetical protein
MNGTYPVKGFYPGKFRKLNRDFLSFPYIKRKKLFFIEASPVLNP